MPYLNHNSYADGQFIFDRILSAFWIAAKWFLKGIIYLPLWFAGYIITSQLLTKKDDPLLWIGLILLFGFVLYQLLFFIKGITICLKRRGNPTWILLFFICTAFTSIVPAWACFDTFHKFAAMLTQTSADLVAWVFSIAFGVYIYSRYHFLTDVAPKLAFRAYQLGTAVTLRLSR